MKKILLIPLMLFSILFCSTAMCKHVEMYGKTDGIRYHALHFSEKNIETAFESSYLYMDDGKQIWLLAGDGHLYLYDSSKDYFNAVRSDSKMGEIMFSITQMDKKQYILIFFIVFCIMLFLCAITILLFRLWKDRILIKEENRFFIYTSRQIRIPLTMVLAPLENLHNKAISEDIRHELRMAMNNMKDIARQISSLMCFEQISNNTDKLELSEHELFSFVHNIINKLIVYAERKQVCLTWKRIGFSYTNVWFDKEKIEPIIMDLLVNAIRCTPIGGEVHLVISYTDEEWSIEIMDSGDGAFIKCYKKSLRILLHKNMEEDNEVIGFFLVRKLLHLHRGRLDIIRTKDNKKMIKIAFPVRREDPYKRELLLPELAVEECLSNDLLDNDSDKGAKHGPSILIVEKDDLYRNFLVDSLSDKYRVTAMSDGILALAEIKAKMPDLVISGIMIDGMKGNELCSRLKSDMNTVHIPIILLTALSGINNYLAGLSSGADRYLPKPCELAQLKAEIASLILIRKTLQGKYINMVFGRELQMPKDDMSDEDIEFVRKAKDFITLNVSNVDYNIDKLSNDMCMSRTSLYSRWKKLGEGTLQEYMFKVKMEKAMLTLQSRRNITAADLAEAAGYSDVKHFREIFKKHYGMGLSEYLKNS